MNIEKILNDYDAMFGKHSLTEIEHYLATKIQEAQNASEWGVLVTLLNEIIGFCRDTTQREKALAYCEELLQVLRSMGLEGRVDYATSLLNIANAYRAFGMYESSIAFYENVYKIYKEHIAEGDFSYASLYNNWSLVYQEMEAFETASDLLVKALNIVDTYEEAVIPQANTRVNLAVSLIQIGTEESYEKAMGYLKEALTIFENDGGRDFHYGAALVAMGDAHSFRKDYISAAKYYKKGMKEIEKHVGRTDNYDRVLEKYQYAKAQNKDMWISNLEKSRKFYETCGKTMIHDKFAEYEEYIAVGLVGEGSDAFGFDDEISEDHDYEPGFCMWLTDAIHEKIGEALQKEYEQLVRHEGRLRTRRGVFTINRFYNGILGTTHDFENGVFVPDEMVEEHLLAEVVNGEVFRDDSGKFSEVRNQLLAYYPEKVWRKKIAKALHDFSQYGQSNYARMMARKDWITADMCVGKTMESAMDLMYLLNRTYAPYYKWKKKGLEKLETKDRVLELLEGLAILPNQKEAWEKVNYQASFVNMEDKKVCFIEEIAGEIWKELKRLDLVGGTDLFLESYLKQVLEGKYMDLIDKIVELEWTQFDQVKNEGGRADCQDNFETFSIMRKSQYMTWTEELLKSYCSDLEAAKQNGWNLIMEKYARMMKSTCPEKYMELEKELPVRSEERIQIQEEIIRIQVEWMEAFANEYPNLSKNMRSIRTSTDNAYNTSFETYLRGELGTYSENTFVLYTGFIISLLKEGKNLTVETMNHTAKLYEYDSLDLAEGK